ncbi:MAG: hypothetical protein RBS99_16690, partial [Rhodospirillales bacterium]|nr:hypothetical protein [Rhodospirillales bacterium]
MSEYCAGCKARQDAIERLTERCAAYKGQVGAGGRMIDGLKAEIERLRAALKKIADTPCPLHDEDAACELLATVVRDARAALSATPVTGQPEAGAGVAETGLRYGDGSGDGQADTPTQEKL